MCVSCAVVNLELPSSASHYAHRAGRTGRMGAPGTVISLAEPRDVWVVRDKLADKLGVEIKVRMHTHRHTHTHTHTHTHMPCKSTLLQSRFAY